MHHNKLYSTSDSAEQKRSLGDLMFWYVTRLARQVYIMNNNFAR
jgi:hypothetical protein